MEQNKYLDFIPKMVDLGLPSKTLWADRNVGAEKPEDYGSYFRFGEPEPYTEESPEYPYNGDEEPFAGTDRDAASVHFNRKCHTPSLKQIRELIDECTWEWTSLNGVKGFEVTGPNGKSIFLPAAGCRYFTSTLTDQGEQGFYWSTTPAGGRDGYFLGFSQESIENISYYNNFRENGYSIRAVTENQEMK